MVEGPPLPLRAGAPPTLDAGNDALRTAPVTGAATTPADAGMCAVCLSPFDEQTGDVETGGVSAEAEARYVETTSMIRTTSPDPRESNRIAGAMSRLGCSSKLLLNCGHAFHVSCLVGWMNSSHVSATAVDSVAAVGICVRD